MRQANRTNMTADSWTPGDTVIQFCKTPPEDRPRWYLVDVPDFVLIIHPSRKPFRASYGQVASKCQDKLNPAPKTALVAYSERIPTPPSRQGRPVTFLFEGQVRHYVSMTAGAKDLGLSAGRQPAAALTEQGWYRYVSKDAWVWLSEGPAPEGVELPKEEE